MEFMPTGSEKSARKNGVIMTKASIVTVGALSLSLMVAPAAQSSTPGDGVTDAVTHLSLYPAPGQPSPSEPDSTSSSSLVEKSEEDIRVATLHAGITAEPNAESPVESLIDSLRTGNHTSARAVAQTVQANAPDVVVLTGVTYDHEHRIAEELRSYLTAGQRTEDGVDYPYMFTAPTNSGRESGLDLNRDGVIGGPEDAVGYGEYAGQYGTVIFSKYPLVENEVRTFQNFLWDDLPENSMPEDRFTDLESSALRLNETSFWDVPIDVDGKQLHILATAVSSEDEQADTSRGEDIRRVIAEYAAGRAWYLYDDDGETASMTPGAPFVVAGVPAAEGASAEDLSVLLESPVLQDTEPEAVTEAPPAEATATRDSSVLPGGRASYVLPSSAMNVSGSGVFRPHEGERGYEVVNPESTYSLDDRLVWVDLTISH